MDLKLNPANPEFFADLKNVTLDGYLVIKQTVKLSKLFAAGGKFDPLKTNPAFKTLTSDLSEYVSTQIKEIIAAEIPKFGSTQQVEEPSYEDQLALSSNNILDRVNSNLELCKMAVLKTASINQNYPPPEDPMNEQVVCLPEIPDVEPIPIKDLDPGFVSPDIWTPIIRDKPNSLEPLDFKLVFNMFGTAIGYEHPYKYELEKFDPIPWTKPARKPIKFPASLKNTSFRFIDTWPKFEELLRHLSEVDEFAVDVEHHSARSYMGLTCLIQITTYLGDYIIDAITLWPFMHKLNFSFTDPKKIKILHGAGMDVLWLQRDFGVYIVGLFDTYQAAKVLGHNGKSLKALLQHYCNVDTNKKYQCSDWRLRPLSFGMIKYARIDTHYLLYIWKRMKNELLQRGKGENTYLLEVFDESKKTCLSTYKRRVVSYRSHLKLFHRCNKDFVFQAHHYAVLKRLYKWRDEYAKEIDESPSYVLPNMIMLTLAYELPDDITFISEICAKGNAPLLDNLETVLDVIDDCMRKMPRNIVPYGWWTPRARTSHMLDLPDTNESRETEDIVPESGGVASASASEPARITNTSNPTGRREYRFCSPYLRYMKCMKVEEDLMNDEEVADVAVSANTENNREREAEESPEIEEDAGEGTSDGFTLVTRRKRRPRGTRVVFKEHRYETRPSTSSSQAYQYSNRNYTSFSNTPKGKSNSKSLPKKRK